MNIKRREEEKKGRRGKKREKREGEEKEKKRGCPVHLSEGSRNKRDRRRRKEREKEEKRKEIRREDTQAECIAVSTASGESPTSQKIDGMLYTRKSVE